MLNFLRKLRQKEMKSGRYLKYAIGEIFLVMVGILLALAINNWNEQRKINQQIKDNLVSLRQDLLIDTTNFANSIRNYQRIIDQKQSIRLDDWTHLPMDSLEFLINSQTNETKPILTTYQKVINGNVKRFTLNQELSRAINQYYTTELSNLEDFQTYENSGALRVYRFWTLEQNRFETEFGYDLPVIQKSTERKRAMLEIMNSPQGRNYIKEDYQRKLRALDQYMLLKAYSQKLLTLINQELEER